MKPKLKANKETDGQATNSLFELIESNEERTREQVRKEPISLRVERSIVSLALSPLTSLKRHKRKGSLPFPLCRSNFDLVEFSSLAQIFIVIFIHSSCLATLVDLKPL